MPCLPLIIQNPEDAEDEEDSEKKKSQKIATMHFSSVKVNLFEGGQGVSRAARPRGLTAAQGPPKAQSSGTARGKVKFGTGPSGAVIATIPELQEGERVAAQVNLDHLYSVTLLLC